MINVLFVHSSSELYGSDRSLLNIIKNIDKRRYRIHVLLPCDGPLVKEIKKIKVVRVTIFEVAVLRRKNMSIKGGMEYLIACHKSIRYIKNYIKRNKIHIVDTNTAVVFPGAIAAKRSRVKSVWHVREIIQNPFENRVISYMMNRYADIIIANSKATRDSIRANKRKLRVVYNSIETPSEVSKIDHDLIVVGMAGRINRWKGQKLFVDAATMVLKRDSNVLFLIAGEAYSGEEKLKEDLESYIKKKGVENKVKLLGQVDEMALFYRSIDLFVLPSIQPEPFGLVVIEAMGYGLPVIATNHGGPTEIINDKKDGYLVDYQNPKQMAQRIQMLISDDKLRKAMGDFARQKQAEQFSISSTVAGVQKCFEEALGWRRK